MRKGLSALLAIVLLFSAAMAAAEDFLLGVEPEPSAITPAYRSSVHPEPEHEDCYWCTPMDREFNTCTKPKTLKVLKSLIFLSIILKLTVVCVVCFWYNRTG